MRTFWSFCKERLQKHRKSRSLHQLQGRKRRRAGRDTASNSDVANGVKLRFYRRRFSCDTRLNMEVENYVRNRRIYW